MLSALLYPKKAILKNGHLRAAREGVEPPPRTPPLYLPLIRDRYTLD
jgi:hypothetical protein